MKVEGVLALIAGVLGLLGSVAMIFLSAFMDGIAGKAVFSLLFGALAIVAAIMSAKKPKESGIMMLIAAVGGFFTSSVFFIVSSILLIISGILSIRKGRNNQAQEITP